MKCISILILTFYEMEVYSGVNKYVHLYRSPRTRVCVCVCVCVCVSLSLYFYISICIHIPHNKFMCAQRWCILPWVRPLCNECPDNGIKQSDGEATVMLKLPGMLSTTSGEILLPLF